MLFLALVFTFWQNVQIEQNHSPSNSQHQINKYPQAKLPIHHNWGDFNPPFNNIQKTLKIDLNWNFIINPIQDDITKTTTY